MYPPNFNTLLARPIDFALGASGVIAGSWVEKRRPHALLTARFFVALQRRTQRAQSKDAESDTAYTGYIL
jgi:hypothetical protein